jgi:ribosomal protein S13
MANKLINLKNVTKEELTSISGVTTEMADKVMQRRAEKELTTVDMKELTNIPTEVWNDTVDSDLNSTLHEQDQIKLPGERSIQDMFDEFQAERRANKQNMAVLDAQVRQNNLKMTEIFNRI